MKKIFLASLSCALALLLGTGGAFAQTPAQKITMSYSSTGMTSIQLFIARDRKMFREEGIEPLLVRMSANTAIAAGIAGELDALASIGSAIRAILRGAPLRVVEVDLRRPIFWLVTRPEYRSVKDLKGKILGIVTINGSQHTTAKKMIALGGLDPEKDLTHLQVGDESLQLQALVSNAIQATAITPPYVFLARDKFKMNVLESSIDKFASIQQGVGVHVKTLQEKPELVKKILRAKARASKFFHENEKETAEMLANVWKTDFASTMEWYRKSKPAFTTTGIPTDEEIKEYLALEAQALKLAEPVQPSRVFDFSLQREVNRELGIR